MRQRFVTNVPATLAAVAAGLCAAACDDLSSFTTDEGQYYEGEVLDADLIRKGFDSGTLLRMTFDVSLVEGDEEHVGPGQITTIPPEGGEVFFDGAELEPITSITHDQLSGFDFPTGRLRNYLFFTRVSGPYDGRLALVVVSLLSDGDVEVRVVMGAEELYGVFTLEKTTAE